MNGVHPEAFKAMDKQLRGIVFKFCRRFWLGEDFKGWHMSRVISVPMVGDLSNPNKWRGVMLMDVCSKIFSSILNGRLFKIVEANGNRFQFGGTPKVGCADGLFTLKTLLNMRRNHNLSTHVAFVDLVKAFDTANHELLIRILKKYGAPPVLCSVVKRLYTDLKVVLKIGKSVREISQEVGVKQGDNMAPVLFLFLMNAFADSLEKIWEDKGLKKVQVQHVSDDDFEDGKRNIAVKSHVESQFGSKKLETLTVYQCLYVDDGAFPFESREQLKLGTQVIYDHFTRFGLDMHIGRTVDGETTASKMKCVFFPPPCFARDRETPSEICNEAGSSEGGKAIENRPVFNRNWKKKEKKEYSKKAAKVKEEQESTFYFSMEETKPVDVADGFITYTMHFKYLGSFISYNLLDDFDINTRIDKANQSMGALKHFFNNPHVNKKSKYLIFKAIPINLLLWGCETWAIKQTHRDKLEAFLQRHLRRILKIPMSQVMEEHISSDQMREKFYNIPNITTMIAVRQLSFIGKVVRSDTPNLPTKSMSTACCNHPRC